jgi:hypothetical protein
MAATRKPKGNAFCGSCGRRGHNSRNPLCPDRIARAAAKLAGEMAAGLALTALADELQARGADTSSRNGGQARNAIRSVVQAARAAAQKVGS